MINKGRSGLFGSLRVEKDGSGGVEIISRPVDQLSRSVDFLSGPINYL